ncbi:MAG TPA: rhomboid family intramembrane serine protease [Gammaproteobacteria bacterium]
MSNDPDNPRHRHPAQGPLPSWPPATSSTGRPPATSSTGRPPATSSTSEPPVASSTGKTASAQPTSRPLHLARTAGIAGGHVERGRLWRAFLPVLAFTLLLWWLHFLASLLDWNLWALGIRPGNVAGLTGILAAPLIHGSWEHLIANTLPVIILGTLLLYSYPRAARWVIPVVWIGSGAGVWLFGQPGSVHAGASGLAHGLMFFLFIIGILRRDPRAMAIAMAVFFLYGGMVLTIFPREADVSWEAHLFGAIPGALLAFLLFRLDSAPPRKVYSWERHDEDDPVIGDQWRHRRAPPPDALEDTDEVPLHGDDEEERW